MGSRVGITEGSVLGIFEGLCDGKSVGSSEGSPEGNSNGKSVGKLRQPKLEDIASFNYSPGLLEYPVANLLFRLSFCTISAKFSCDISI